VRECQNGFMPSESPAFETPVHVGRPNLGSIERFQELAGQALERRWLSNDGPLVRELEARIEEYLGVAHCIAVNNGTIGLEIAIRALDLTGEVIVPSWTFIATAHALRWLGLTPVFVDVDPSTHCLDPDAVRRAITPRTTGILAVHLWGRAADVESLTRVAAEAGLPLLFDAAHAFGVSARGRMVGSFGSAEVFSFHATKFFNTIEGGAITTNDDDLAGRLRLMRNFGFAGEDRVVSDGTNGKLNEISAAMGLANLEHLDSIIDVNRSNYERYARALDGVAGLSILPIDDRERGNYQYVVALVDPSCPVPRDELLDRLRANNVLARRYFWPGAHRMEPYRTLDPSAGLRLPNTEMIADQVIVLPTGTAVGDAEIDVIVRIIREAVGSA